MNPVKRSKILSALALALALVIGLGDSAGAASACVSKSNILTVDEQTTGSWRHHYGNRQWITIGPPKNNYEGADTAHSIEVQVQYRNKKRWLDETTEWMSLDWCLPEEGCTLEHTRPSNRFEDTRYRYRSTYRYSGANWQSSDVTFCTAWAS